MTEQAIIIVADNMDVYEMQTSSGTSFQHTQYDTIVLYSKKALINSCIILCKMKIIITSSMTKFEMCIKAKL